MIADKAMLASFHLSIWMAVKHDRKISYDVAEQHGALQSHATFHFTVPAVPAETNPLDDAA